MENTLDGVQEQVVDVPEGSEPVAEETQSEPVAPVQDKEDNSKYAAARRAAEAEKRALEEQNKRLLDALAGYGYEGSPEEIADALMAAQRGITQEEARAEREAEEVRRNAESALRGEMEFYKDLAVQKLMDDDLRTLQSVYPDVKSIEELGEDFMSLLTATRDPILSYEAYRAKQEKTKKPVPPEIGSVESALNKQKDYYTSDEVDRLTSEDYDKDPSLWDTVRKSMLKWK